MEKKHILIVEDEGLIAKDLQSMLKRLGYHVPTTVGTGELAIQTAATNRPDLILMDINLRGQLDGVQAAEAINAQQDVPIVFLTANSDEPTMQRAKVTDPFGFMIKPFEERSIQAGIEMALYKHQTNRQTRAREQWLSVTLKSIADGVITTDHEGRVTFINRVAETLTGRTHSEALGRPYVELFPIIDATTRQTAPNLIDAALREGVARNHVNHSLLLGRDELARHIEYSVAPIRSDAGLITGCVIVFCDVTERRQLEAELRQSQKLEAIGKLAGSIAHDFNNAITAVMGYSSLIMSRLTPGDSLHDDASQILRAAEHSARLTRQLLAFSRKEVLHPVSLDLGVAVQEMHGLLRRLIRENITVSISAPKDLWLIKSDPGQIEQLVLNMAVNARDAMPAGGLLHLEAKNVTLTTEAAATIKGARAGEFVCLKIADTGTGMSPEIIQQIFEPFFTTKGLDKGTGLGLSTCEGIIRQAAGFIRVTSRVGMGTTFEVYFPRTAEAAAQEAVSIDAPTTNLSVGETILLVEDEEAVRMLSARILEDLGYVVLEAGNGFEALAALEKHGTSVDLIITDLVMPEMSGRELVENIRAANSCPCVLFISGYTDDEIIKDAVFGAEVAFLHKPFTPDVLAKKVRETLLDQSKLTGACLAGA
ncbi:MAG: response regulator [Chthoniobacter sp.]|nr:response regulator [Chthoniobacter sp.]